MRILFVLAFLVPSLAFGQERTGSRVYMKSASEFIFSLGQVEAYSDPFLVKEINVDPVLRFSGFFHLQEQVHIDFSRNFGLYTGIGIRNVGMINKLNDSVKVKQRVYSLGIPLALKFGKLPGGFYVALGAEGELFLHYKQKAIYDDEKKKSGEWFSDKVNLFNPSVFLDINSNKGTYLRFKYYLTDFLVSDKQRVRLDNGQEYAFFPESSQLFYVAIGTSIRHQPGSSRKPSIRKDGTAWYSN